MAGLWKKRHAELTEAREVVVTEEDADIIFTVDYPVSPQVLWNWLHDPEKRALWMEGTRWSVKERPGGRQGVGAVNHCAHDGGETLERVLDWRPFRYYTCEGKGGGITYRMCNQLTPTVYGCRASMLCKIYLPLPGWILRPLGKLFFRRLAGVGKVMARLQVILDDEAKESRSTMDEMVPAMSVAL
jgi:hypothetical protein